MPIVRSFADHQQARAAVEAFKARGIEPQAISIVARSRAEAHLLDQETGAGQDLEEAVRAHPMRDLLDWLGRVEAFVVPGFSAVLATGDLGLHLARGSPASGAITAALVDLGVPVDEAARLERDVLDGRILVVVHGPSAVAAAAAALDTPPPEA